METKLIHGCSGMWEGEGQGGTIWNKRESTEGSKASLCSRQTRGVVFCSDKGADFRSLGLNA